MLPFLGLDEGEDGVLADLPVPKVPFGLSLDSNQFTDATLKELPRFEEHPSGALASLASDPAGLRPCRSAQIWKGWSCLTTPSPTRACARFARSKGCDISLASSNVTIEGFKHLARLKDLQSLYLCNTKVDDKILKILGGMKSLRVLNLNSTDVTDDGLKALAGLTALEALDLSQTAVTDAGVKHLQPLQKLRHLSLASPVVKFDPKSKSREKLYDLPPPPTVTDASLRVIKHFSELQTLDLTSTSLTGEGLAELKDLKHLRSLNLQSTEITGPGLKGIDALRQITSLSLCVRTDDDVKSLKNLTQLESLRFYGSEITGSSLEDLRPGAIARPVLRQ